MLWYPLGTDKAQTVMQEMKDKAVDVARTQLGLANYQIREIRPEDLPSPSTVNFTITIAAGLATLTVTRVIQSNSILIVGGFYAPDVFNNRDGIIEGTVGEPILHMVWISRGTELIRKWPLCPVFPMNNTGAVTEGYCIFYPEDVAQFVFYAKATATVDQVSQCWYLGVCLLPPGSVTATRAAT